MKRQDYRESPQAREPRSSFLSGESSFALPEPPKEQNIMENGRTTKLYYQRFISLESSLNRIMIINLSLLIIYYEFDFMNSSNKYTSLVNVILYLIFGCTCIEIPMCIFREYAKLDLEFYQKNVFKSEMTRSRMLSLAFEVFILLLQPYPLINDMTFQTSDYKDHVSYEFKYNYLLTLLSLLRLYTVFRSLMNNTDYMNPRSNRLSKMYLCKADYMFALKCMFKDYPTQLIGSAFFVSIFLFSFAIRVCERELIKLDPKYVLLNYQFEYLSNSIWLTIITMTTVGYGDYYPRTLFGRVICIILVIWGIFIVSIMVVVLTNTFQMEQRELKVLSLVKKLQKKQALREAGASLIQFVYRNNRDKSMQQLTPSEQQKYQRKYKKLRKTFNNINKEIKSICEEDDVYEEMSRQFQCLDDDLKNLNKNQESLMGFIHDKIEKNGSRASTPSDTNGW